MHSKPERSFAGLAATGLAALLVAAAASPVDARNSRDATREELVASRPTGLPLMAIVSLRDQRVTIYDADGKILRAPVSTGQTGYETPAGIYNVIQKEAEHYSNLYDDASMPFMQRITWSGIALHAGALPGYPASHGCIRMPYDFAERLFDMTKMGMRVIVARNDVAPAAIVHPLLFQTKPLRGEIASSETAEPMRLGIAASQSDMPPPGLATGPKTLKSIAAAKAAEAEAATKRADEAKQVAAGRSLEAGRVVRVLRVANIAKVRAEAQLTGAERALWAAGTLEAVQQAEEARAKALARIAEAQAQLDAAKAEAQPKADAAALAVAEAKAAEAARVAAVAAAKEAMNRIAPVSVFISRQTQRLYVRKAFQPVLESPVTIRDADNPIGTHIYTALDDSNVDAGVRWSVVSMYGAQDKGEPGPNGRSRRDGERKAEPVGTDVDAAKAALDRIDIPKDALERISEAVSPGSSLIVSDEDISKETGKGTDFVVLMSGEPQGGIKMRRRPEPWSRYDRSPYGGYGGGPFFRW